MPRKEVWEVIGVTMRDLLGYLRGPGKLWLGLLVLVIAISLGVWQAIACAIGIARTCGGTWVAGRALIDITKFCFFIENR